MGDIRRSSEPVCHAVVLSNKVRAVTEFALGLSHAGSWHLVLLTQMSAHIKDVSSAAKQVANNVIVIILLLMKPVQAVGCKNFSGAGKQVAHIFHPHESRSKPSTQVSCLIGLFDRSVVSNLQGNWCQNETQRLHYNPVVKPEILWGKQVSHIGEVGDGLTCIVVNQKHCLKLSPVLGSKLHTTFFVS